MNESDLETLPVERPAGEGIDTADRSDGCVNAGTTEADPAVDRRAGNLTVTAEDVEYQRWARARFGEAAANMA